MISKEMMKDFLENDRIIKESEAVSILKETYPEKIIKSDKDAIRIWSKEALESDCEMAGPNLVLHNYSYAGYPENQYWTGLLACTLSAALYTNWAKKQQRIVEEKRELESLGLVDSLDILYN